MKRIFSSKIDRLLAKFGIFLIMAALIAGMAGCGPVHNLTISSTAGGSVTAPGEGTFTYEEGTVVPLVAEADEDYLFVNWTGDVSTIADVNAPSTNITVYDSYSITANFYNPEIRDWYDLDDVRDNLAGNYTLMNDLDSTTAGYTELASPTANEGKGWQPIGTDDDPFTGAFDGQGYKICDLFINRPDEMFVGIFSIVGEGQIENIGVVNVTVTGDCEVGGLVGHIEDSTVSNSYVTGNITGERYKAGGLVGCILHTSVSNSYFTGNVNGHNEVGGLAGDTCYGNIINSYSTGNVNGDYHVGGLLGSLGFGTLRISYSSGSVAGESCVGGLVGSSYADGTVSDSYSTGNVTGNSHVGGLVGRNEATVNNSFWDTETSGLSTSAGGMGKNTTEMKSTDTFSGAGWNITAVVLNETNPAYIWNIVNNVTYPFLSWQPV